MVMFMAHIAFAMQLLALTAGLVAFCYGCQIQTKLLKAVSILVVLFALVGAVCTGYSAKQYMMAQSNGPEFKLTMDGKGPHFHCSTHVDGAVKD